MKTLRVLLSAWSMVAVAAPAVAADVSGTWRVTISTPDGTINGEASLQQAGDEVTGWIGPNADNRIAVKGTVTKNTLTLKTFPQPGRTVAFDQCRLTVAKDKMTGTIERNGSPNQGSIEFVRSRPDRR